MDPAFLPERFIKFHSVIPISAKQKHSTDALKDKLREVIDLCSGEETVANALLTNPRERNFRRVTNPQDVIKKKLTEHFPIKVV